MSNFQPVRGTRDLVGEIMQSHKFVSDMAGKIAGFYGFDEMATPVLEFASVFQRPLGETTDIVTKEMYSFTDKGGEQICLRPENTAGIARAFVSGGLQNMQPCKFFYAGPMFRYERPQMGRLRQFHQIGIEMLGVADTVADIEVIACGFAVLEALGCANRVTLEINSLGDTESRTAYRKALVEYFLARQSDLSPESLKRLEINPMRILDSKDEGDQKLYEEAPVFWDFLNAESKAFFEKVKQGLTALGIPYKENPRLVRGLDYYAHTAFEFTTKELGAQGTVMAGGRYDGLVEMLGGPHTPSIGWAAGIERLAMLVGENVPAKPRPIAFIPLGLVAEKKGLLLVNDLRQRHLRVEMAYEGNLKKRMKHANKISASHCLILGEDDLAKNEIQLKNMDHGKQIAIPLGRDVVDNILQKIGKV